MDLEALVDQPSSYRKTPTISVHQAEVALRLGFLRKVYGILTAQLLLTLVVCISCRAVTPLREFLQGSLSFFLLVFIGTIISLIALMFKRHDSPANMYLLGLFTLLESLSLGTAITYYDIDVVVKALLITTGVFVALTLYVMQGKYDYSTWGAGLFSLLWILFIASILQMIFWSEALEFVISVGGAVLFCGFILFDTYMIMHRVSTEEYILTAVDLYLDFINLFIYILRILDSLKNK